VAVSAAPEVEVAGLQLVKGQAVPVGQALHLQRASPPANRRRYYAAFSAAAAAAVAAAFEAENAAYNGMCKHCRLVSGWSLPRCDLGCFAHTCLLQLRLHGK
jgi:hypothetical protein